MKKLILILIVFLSATKAMAQQVGKVDTICPPPPLPKTATLAELIKRMEGMEVDVNGNVLRNGKPINGKSVKMGCQDVYQPAENFNCEILERITENRPYGRLIYKPDTTQYELSKYRPAVKIKLGRLLNILGDFKTDGTGSLFHQGKAVTSFKVNGKELPSAIIGKQMREMPFQDIAIIELTNNYSDILSSGGHFKNSDPYKTLNIILRKSKKFRLKQ